MNEFGSFSVSRKSAPSDRLAVLPPSVDARLVVLFYLCEGFHRRAVSRTVDDFEIDSARFAKGPRMQLSFTMNGTPFMNTGMISICQMISEAPSAEMLFSVLDRMITAISFCRLFVEDLPLPSTGDSVVAKLVRKTQHHRLVGSIEGRQVSRITTVSICLAPNEECYEPFIRVDKKLLEKLVSLALMYFESASLYKAPFGEEFCTGFLDLSRRLLSGEVQNFDGYRAEIYYAVSTLFEKVRSAATAAGLPLCEVFMS